MTEPTSAATRRRPWRDPQRIADIAQCEASLRESHTERAGLIYMLAEILTALHRQAEAQERTLELTERIAVALPGVTDAI
jgi:HD-like signal output (HDOD) protein